jgi:hypothetical protein
MLRRKLAVESLEQRQLMAGDVTVAVTHGEVAITGDQAGNQIEITQNADNTIRIAGSLLSGTTINGQPSVTLKNATFGNITIETGAGNDRVNIRDVAIQQLAGSQFRLGLGAGSDFATVNNVKFAAELVVAGDSLLARETLGDGRDTVRLQEVETGGSALLVLGGGDLDLATVDSSTIGRDLTINGLGGRDMVAVAATDIAARFNLNLGNGNDIAFVMSNNVGAATFNGGADEADPLASPNFDRDVLLHWDFLLDSNYDPVAAAEGFEHIYDVDDILFNPDFDGLEDELDALLEQLGIE